MKHIDRTKNIFQKNQLKKKKKKKKKKNNKQQKILSPCVFSKVVQFEVLPPCCYQFGLSHGFEDLAGDLYFAALEDQESELDGELDGHLSYLNMRQQKYGTVLQITWWQSVTSCLKRIQNKNGSTFWQQKYDVFFTVAKMSPLPVFLQARGFRKTRSTAKR